MILAICLAALIARFFRILNGRCQVMEKGEVKDGGGQGWADVWKRDHFGWENKKPGSDLNKALAQLREYSGNLGNPPLLIVCDR